MKRLWLVFGAVFLGSFLILGWIGTEIFRQAPPIPKKVVATDGKTLVGDNELSDGQNVWQAMGGMQVGSVWGHGSYVAPDWTADYLHREALFILDKWSNAENGKPYAQADSEKQAVLRQRLQNLVRSNTYDSGSDSIKIDPVRAEAFASNLEHYKQVFINGSTEYAIQRGAQTDPEKVRKMTAFFFWTAWASAANRPGNTISYTSNFPSEPRDPIDRQHRCDGVVLCRLASLGR